MAYWLGFGRGGGEVEGRVAANCQAERQQGERLPLAKERREVGK